MKKALFLLVINLLLFSFGKNIFAQSWKKIVPLISTCESLKKDFPIKDCNNISSKVSLPNYDIAIYYSNKSCQEGERWNVPKGVVTQVFINLKPFIRLSDYKDSLGDYVMKPEDDLPDYRIYTSNKQGISLTVLVSEKYGELIQDIFLFPSFVNEDKFKCGQRVSGKTSCPKK